MPSPYSSLRLGLAALTCFCTSLAHAEPSKLPADIGFNGGEQETARTAAMGGAVRALSNSIDALYLNPANVAVTRVYHIGATAQIWPEAKRQTYGAAAVDSILNQQRVAGGLGVNYISQDPDGLARRGLDIRFALAFPVSDVFFVGGAVRYMGLSQNGVPANVGLSPSLAAAGLPKERVLSEVTFDAGVTLKPVPAFAISVVGTNLTNPGVNMMPLTVGGGVGYGGEVFSLEGDASFDLSSYDKVQSRLAVGGELLLADHFPLRAGYRYTQTYDAHAVGGGLGYVASEFSIDAGVHVNVHGPKATAIVIALRYHLDGAGVVGGDMQ